MGIRRNASDAQVEFNHSALDNAARWALWAVVYRFDNTNGGRVWSYGNDVKELMLGNDGSIDLACSRNGGSLAYLKVDPSTDDYLVPLYQWYLIAGTFHPTEDDLFAIHCGPMGKKIVTVPQSALSINNRFSGSADSDSSNTLHLLNRGSALANRSPDADVGYGGYCHEAIYLSELQKLSDELAKGNLSHKPRGARLHIDFNNHLKIVDKSGYRCHETARTNVKQGQTPQIRTGPLWYYKPNTVLVINAISQGQTVDQAALTQHHNIAPADVDQTQTLDTSGLTQHHSISLDDIAQSQLLDAAALTQHYILSPAEVNQSQSLDTTTLTVSGVLSVNSVDQAQTIDLAVLTQHHNIAPADVDQAQTVDSTSLTVGSLTLTLASLNQAQQLDQATLTQHNVLVVNDITQAQILDQCSFAGVFGWLNGEVVIVSALAGAVTVCPALESEIDISPALTGINKLN